MIAARTGNDYTEITKVFAGGAVQQEVIKVWSTDADTWVYEATDETSGALPLTFHADGSALVDYRLYGNTGGVGTWDDTEQSYKLDMAVGSNILQSSEIEQGSWQTAARTEPEKIESNYRCRSKNIYPISGQKIFYDFKSLNVNVAFVDSAGLYLGSSGFKSGVGAVDVPANAVKCLFIIANTNGGTNITPAQVIAAGIWASVDATVTPIYIGDTPLGEDEYVDYQAGKIYRINNLWGITAEDFENSTIVLGAAKGYVISGLTASTNYTLSSSIPGDASSANLWIGGGSSAANGVWNGNSRTMKSNENGKLTVYYRTNRLTDYEQYWYRLVETLSPYLPTDPPVPLPALPTCEGNTVIDYNGTPAPSSVEIKFKKGW